MKSITSIHSGSTTVMGDNIPLFPEFRKIDIEDKTTIESFIKDFLPYSDFSFTNLYCWRPNGNISEISILNDNLIVKAYNITTATPEISIIGTSKIKESIAYLIDKFGELSLVPAEITTELLSLEDYVMEEDPGNHDYILDIKDLVSLRGNKYKSKRNDVKRFRTRYPNHILKRLEMIDIDQTKEEIHELYHKWLNNRQVAGFNAELNAIDNLFTLMKKYRHVIILGVYIEDKLRAFVIQEPSRLRYILEGFAKADHSFKGISSYLMHMSAKALAEMDYKYINYEQDLDIENLRKQKLSWRPVNMLKKYKIRKNA